MDHEKQPGSANHSPANRPEGELAHNPAVDEFFTRLKSDMHRPKPGQEAIAAALQAIQRLALEVDAQESGDDLPAEGSGLLACAVCGAQNREQNKFCASCGVPLQAAVSEELEAPAEQPGPRRSTPAAGQHHYHHHYHHHYFSSPDGIPTSVPEGRVASGSTPRDAARTRAPLAGASLSRAEAAVRKLTQDWALACNTKHLDDLVDLYTADALLLRSNFPAVRGAAAIREFFVSVLEAGLGEVELDPLRVELFGEVAFEAGRCKMLVPVAMGKRREERGKYLLISARQGGEWKLVADCWSSDLSLRVGPEPEIPRPSPHTAGPPLPKPPRKGI